LIRGSFRDKSRHTNGNKTNAAKNHRQNDNPSGGISV